MTMIVIFIIHFDNADDGFVSVSSLDEPKAPLTDQNIVSFRDV